MWHSLGQNNGPGSMIELSGHRLVRATVYGTITPSSLSVLVPDTLSGPLYVRVANKINGSVRSFTFMDAITPIT